MTVHAYTDGASRGNPGDSGIGVILKNDKGEVIYSGSDYIGKTTNNSAEYQALIACLRKAGETSCKKLIVHSDSELMVRQLQGRYRVKNKGLLKFLGMVRELLRTAPFDFEIVHIDRSQNRDADLLANAGIDTALARRTLRV